ncbi:hypothetical protein ACFX2I_007264 [Malus domestica]
MGVNYYYCFSQFPSPERLPLRKPKCIWGGKNMREKLEQSDNEQTKKKKQRQQEQMTVVKKKELTLEEWFLASSSCRNNDINSRVCNNSEGEYNGSGGNWVYPSLGGEDSDDVTSTYRNSFSLQKLLTGESGRSDVYDPCLCINESSGKVKKRVSFKLQEEADIFIFCSPDHQGDDQEETRYKLWNIKLHKHYELYDDSKTTLLEGCLEELVKRLEDWEWLCKHFQEHKYLDDSKFPVIDMFNDVYVRPGNEITKQLHVAELMQEVTNLKYRLAPQNDKMT